MEMQAKIGSKKAAKIEKSTPPPRGSIHHLFAFLSVTYM
jgi:hypothetical protein